MNKLIHQFVWCWGVGFINKDPPSFREEREQANSSQSWKCNDLKTLPHENQSGIVYARDHKNGDNDHTLKFRIKTTLIANFTSTEDITRDLKIYTSPIVMNIAL